MSAVERIARALCAVCYDDYPEPRRTETVDRYWRTQTDAALAALRAIRRPTDDMIRAGMKYQFDTGKTGISISDTWAIWEAMIDAGTEEGVK